MAKKARKAKPAVKSAIKKRKAKAAKATARPNVRPLGPVLPKGWHNGWRNAPISVGVYATSRECLVEKGKVKGNGYAEWDGRQWQNHENWGRHDQCSDFIWREASGT